MHCHGKLLCRPVPPDLLQHSKKPRFPPAGASSMGLSSGPRPIKTAFGTLASQRIKALSAGAAGPCTAPCFFVEVGHQKGTSSTLISSVGYSLTMLGRFCLAMLSLAPDILAS